MKKSKLLPAWLLIPIDLFLIGAVLCSFAYFHHVRTLWGVIEDDKSDNVYFGKKHHSDDSNDAGDFTKTLPDVFLSADEEIVFTDTTYISQDICLNLTQEDIELSYNDKTYKVRYFVYDIYIRNIENLYTVSVNEREPIDELIDSAADLTDPDGEPINDGPAIAAVNGDYWANAELVLRNGLLLKSADYISNDICVLYYDGTMETISPGEYNWEKIADRSPYQIWEFGPSLLDEDGNALSDYTGDYDDNVIDNRHPRCGIGYYEPGHYCFVVVDGRSDVSDGVRMFQLADIFEELGCKVAYNLDGGDSCQAYFNENVVRESSSREDQRDLYDIVGIGEVKK